MRFVQPLGNPGLLHHITHYGISNAARTLLIFSYGLFSIAAQTLLFREFITTFEGNDISVGIFFASWFLWVGLGAVLVYRVPSIAEKLLENIEFLFLAYLPAFILQLVLIIQARDLAGAESYTLLSIRAVLLLSAVVNAPLSIITGMLFPIACRWVVRDSAVRRPAASLVTRDPSDERRATGHELPVSHVYIIEAAGSFFGGLGVTVLLGFGVSLAKIFFILAFVVSVSAFAVQLAKVRQCSEPVLRKRHRISASLMFLLPICSLLCLTVGIDKPLMRYVRTVKWTKLLPVDALTGSFQTPQAEYLYGLYHGQWVAVCQGSVVEALPDETTNGRIAATVLCQNPDARRVLVVGLGLGLCREFLRLPQIETISWTHCDSEYVQKVNRFIPPDLKISDKRFHRLVSDVRSLLAAKKQYYDIVVLNLPEATSSVLNRYYTRQFYRKVKESLRTDGVLGVRIAGGENIMGTELINLGASTKLTLEKVFSQLVLTPGEDTWFIASDSESLTGDPGTLRDRFAMIEGGTDVFSPQALLSVYLPDRAAAALENYSGADLPEELLVNRDSKPLTHLYSLLLAAKQSGAPVTRLVKHLALAGPLVFFIPVLVFIVLRGIYIISYEMRGAYAVKESNRCDIRSTSFDSTFLVFSAGLVSIGIVIVLMYLYQTRFGSLYLHIGVISSVFMVGLTAGALLTSSLLTHSSRLELRVTNETLLFVVILVHTLILATIAFWPGEQWTPAQNTIKSLCDPAHLTFAIAFVLCGLCAGAYFPLAAKQLADSDLETGQAASKLETADHIGASAGGLLTGLALVPVLGSRETIFVFILLLLANVPPAVLRIYRRAGLGFRISRLEHRMRRFGYILFGIGLSVILCSNLLAHAGRKLVPSLPEYAAGALAGPSRLESRQASIVGDKQRKVDYFEVYEVVEAQPDDATKEKLAGYIFSSEDLAPEVHGFGGKMNLAVYVDTTGKLINFHIIRSNETPAYLELLSQWRGQLNERQLFSPNPFVDVHAVTGATVSSEAILSALQVSGHRFATQILGRPLESELKDRAHRASYLPDTQGAYLIGAFILTLLVIYRGGFWSRLAALCFNLVVGGIILNVQYSSEQIATVLSLYSPAVGLTGVFLLVVGIPLLVIFFGNVYCGYLCPFGAVQELISCIVPDRFKQPASTETMRRARFVKYAVLFVVVIVFFLSRNRTTLAADPLIKVFNLRFTIYDFQLLRYGGLIVAAALIGSIFYTRFWCWYLCPVGAFLSLLNNVVVLKRYLPAKKFGRCEFGLTAKDRMDCLSCEGCRYGAQKRKSARAQEPKHTQALLPCVLVVAAFVSMLSVNRFLTVSAALSQPAVSVSSAGQPRNVDLRRIEKMIHQGKLSDREAEFYEKVD